MDNLYGRHLGAGMGTGWAYIRVGWFSRGMALRVVVVFLGGTLIGSVAPESGNLAVRLFRVSEGQFFNPFNLPVSHIFNPIFLVIGIIGVGVAFCLGFRRSN